MEYDLSLIDTMEFEEETVFGMQASYELTSQQIKGMPMYEEDLQDLKERLYELFQEKFDGSYAKVEARCDISEDSLRKFLRYRSGRSISAAALAKFCVGARVSPDEAEELFELSGRKLNPKNKFYYIFLCELQNGGDILEFDKDLTEHGLKPIISLID